MFNPKTHVKNIFYLKMKWKIYTNLICKGEFLPVNLKLLIETLVHFPIPTGKHDYSYLYMQICYPSNIFRLSIP